MTITVNTPDGGTAQFPDDTDTATITSAMKAKFGGPDSGGEKSLTDDSVMGQIGNTAYRAVNTGTLHALDYGLAGLHAIERGTGYDTNATDLSQIRAENEDFAGKHPLLSLGADVAGYGLGFGKLGIAAKAADAAAGLGAGARLAQGIGGAIEGGAASGLGSFTGGDSVGDSLKAAALGGGLGGALGAAAGKVAKSPPVGQSIADLQTAKQASIDALENQKIGNYPAYKKFDAGFSSLTPGEQSGLSGAMKAQLDDTRDLIANNPTLTGRDIWSMRKNLAGNDVVKSAEDAVASKKVGDALHSLSPDLINDANMTHARFSDAKWLTDTTDPAELVAGAAKRVDPKSKYLYNLAGKTAMQTLADSAPGRLNKGARNVAAYGLNHAMAVGGLGYLGGALGHSGIGEMLGLMKGTGPFNPAGYVTDIGLNAGTKKAREAALATILSNRLATPDMYARMPGVYRGGQTIARAAGLGGDF